MPPLMGSLQRSVQPFEIILMSPNNNNNDDNYWDIVVEFSTCDCPQDFG